MPEEGFRRNYDIRIKSLRELVSDCDPQVGGRAIRIERDLKTSLENNEISRDDLSRFQNQLDEQMSIFAIECLCKKRTN